LKEGSDICFLLFFTQKEEILMFISSIQSVDTGGHVTVEELVIENGGELKAIGITADSIVGYSADSILEAELEDELFVCNTKNKLDQYVPKTVSSIVWGLFTAGGEVEWIAL
jgi:hypothetical protein